MQMPNGDIIVTELKTVIFQYSWDDKKGKLVRSQAGNKSRKTKPRKSRKLANALAEDLLQIKELA
jgi:hypothetical protein